MKNTSKCAFSKPDGYITILYHRCIFIAQLQMRVLLPLDAQKGNFIYNL